MNRNEERTVLIVVIGLLFSLCCIPDLSPAAQPDVHDATSRPHKKLVVAVYHDPPFMIKKGPNEWAGLNVDIWRIVALQLELPYRLEELPVHAIRPALTNGTIDISIASQWITAKELHAIDYAFPTGGSRLAVAMLPDTLQHPWLLAIRFFFTWGTLKIIAFLLLILCALGTILWFIERKHNPDHFGSGLKGIGSGIYWVGSVLTSGNCSDVGLKSLPGRALGLLWMLICALALTALIASVTTALNESSSAANVVSQKTICTMNIGVTAGSRQADILHTMQCPVKEYPSMEEGMKALLDKKIQAFAQGEITLSYLAEHEYRNRIVVHPTDFMRMPFAFALPKGSPLRAKIDIPLIALMERPEWIRLLNRYGLNANFEGLQLKRSDRRIISSAP